MRNEQFLSRWPTGRGEGYIGYSKSLKMAIAATGPLCFPKHQFEVISVKVANTGSLGNGGTEAWSRSGDLIGPLFLPVSAIFDTEAEAAADINNTLQWAIETKQGQIEALQHEIDAISIRKVT